LPISLRLRTKESYAQRKNRINYKWQVIQIVTDYTLLWKVLMVMAFIFSLFMYWNRKLSHAKLLTETALAKLQKRSITE